MHDFKRRLRQSKNTLYGLYNSNGTGLPMSIEAENIFSTLSADQKTLMYWVTDRHFRELLTLKASGNETCPILEGIDRIIKKQPKTEEECVLFSGQKTRHFSIDKQSKEFTGGVLRGCMLNLPLSTSKSIEIAIQFAYFFETFNGPGTILKITVPKGSRILDVSAFFGPRVQKVIWEYDEREVLLLEGTTLVITGEPEYHYSGNKKIAVLPVHAYKPNTWPPAGPTSHSVR